MNIKSRNGRRAIVEFHYLVSTPSSVDHFTDRHELGLYTGDEYRAALNDAGLDVDYDPHGLTGRGLYIATRRADPRHAHELLALRQVCEPRAC